MPTPDGHAEVAGEHRRPGRMPPVFDDPMAPADPDGPAAPSAAARGPQPTLYAGPATLRPTRAEDEGDVYEACQDAETQAWTSIPVPYTREHARAFVREYAPSYWASGLGACWAITRAGADRFCGALDLRVEAADPARAEIAFHCASWARGGGLTTAAVRRAARWGFEDRGLERIEWRAFVGNEASRRVAHKAGFVDEGLQRRRLVARGRRYDSWVASLLPHDLARQD